MAVPQLVTPRDFTTSRYGELAEQSDQLPEVLARAEAAIQSQIRTQIKPATYTERYKASGDRLFVNKRPLVSVTSLTRRFSPVSPYVTIPTSEYSIVSGPDYIDVFVPIKGYDIELTYVAGYPETPADLKEAIIMQTVLFLQRDIEVYGAGDGKEPGIMYMYNDIDRILCPYKKTSMPWR